MKKFTVSNSLISRIKEHISKNLNNFEFWGTIEEIEEGNSILVELDLIGWSWQDDDDFCCHCSHATNDECFQYILENVVQDIDDLHEEIRNWIDSENLPCHSLDEIPLTSFSPSQMIIRDEFLKQFETI